MTQWNFGYGDIDIQTPINELKGTGWAAEDNLHNIYSRMKESVSPPAPLSIKMASGTNNAVPNLTQDGTYFLLPGSATAALARYGYTKSVQWTVARTDIDASADFWAPMFWYDNVDAAIWVIGVDTGTTPDTNYLAKIDHSTGGVTNVGSFQADGLGTSLASTIGFFFRRAAHGSGNFTLHTSDGLIYIISSADGSIVSGPTQLTLNSVYLNDNVSYQTADGKIVIGNFQVSYYGGQWFLPIFRGGGRGVVGFDQGVNMLAVSMGDTADWACAIDWDDYVAIVSYCQSSGSLNLGGFTRFYDKTDFDRWLGDLADMLNLPVTA